MLDLYRATRDEVIRLVLEQRDALAEQERRHAQVVADLEAMRAAMTQMTAQVGRLAAENAALRAQLGEGPPPGPTSGAASRMPGHKAQQAAPREATGRTRREQGAGRSRMAATQQVVHALGTCPDCGIPLAGGSPKRTREVIDLAPPQVVVTEHVFVERRCPVCHRRWVPSPALAGEVTGQGRFGHRLTSLIAVLREEARVPVRRVQAILRMLTGVSVSVGAIVAAGTRVAQAAAPVVATLQAQVQTSPVVHLDETGWREAGRNRYVWTASTPTVRLFCAGSRAKGMVDALVGADYAGVIVSDFYAAYTHDDRQHQYCWAHLWRDIEDLVRQHPDDPALLGWVAGIGQVYQQAMAATGPPAARRTLRQALEAQLRDLCIPWQDQAVPHRRLCARILAYRHALVVFVTDPAVPPTNNAAERSLRHLVVARAISGGTRSAQGTATKMILQSLFGTWRLQGINPFSAAVDLLASPQL